MNVSKIKKISYICVTVLIFVLLILSFNIKKQIKGMGEIVYSISAEQFNNLSMQNCHSEIDENGNAVYSSEGGYPIVYLTPVEEELNCIEIVFNEPVEQPLGVGLYYSHDGQAFSESSAYHASLSTGDQSIDIFLPKNTYSAYMLSITGGNYSVQMINYGIDNFTNIPESFSNLSSYYKINWIAIFSFLVLIVGLIIFEKKYGYFALIKSFFKMVSQCRFFLQIKNKWFSKDDYNFLQKSARKTANTFTVLMLVFGSLLIFLSPPMTTPDEITHFSNVCNLVSCNFVDGKNVDGQVGVFLADEEISFMQENDSKFGIGYNYSENYSFEQMLNFNTEYSYSGGKTFLVNRGAAINPCAYLSCAILTGLLKLILGANDVFTLYLYAKLSNLIFSTLIIRLALLKTPIMRNTMLLLALMPGTIFQLCSVSYDVGAISGSFLLFAYGTRLILADSKYRVSIGDIIAVCFSCSCLFACKFLYICLAIILFAISYKKFGSIKRYIASICSVIASGIIFYYIPTVINKYLCGTFVASGNPKNRIMLENWKLIPTIIYDSLSVNQQFYTNTFVGNLGWYKAPLPQAYVNFFIILISLVVVIEICSVKGLNVKARVTFGIGALTIVSGIIMSMYLGCAGFGGNVAGGVQGRYFIPAAIFIPIVFANPILCRFKYTDKIYAVLDKSTKCVAAAYCMLTCAIIFTAYWL